MEVVKLRFSVVDISAVAQGIVITQCASQGIFRFYDITPGIIEEVLILATSGDAISIAYTIMS